MAWTIKKKLILSGFHEAALAALRQSWRWAPQSRSLSNPRVLLAADYWPDLTAGERRRVTAELRFARQTDPAFFARLTDAHPRFAALCEQHGVSFIGPPAHVSCAYASAIRDFTWS